MFILKNKAEGIRYKVTESQAKTVKFDSPLTNVSANLGFAMFVIPSYFIFACVLAEKPAIQTLKTAVCGMDLKMKHYIQRTNLKRIPRGDPGYI